MFTIIVSCLKYAPCKLCSVTTLVSAGCKYAVDSVDAVGSRLTVLLLCNMISTVKGQINQKLY